jgi:hypothetical protein
MLLMDKTKPTLYYNSINPSNHIENVETETWYQRLTSKISDGIYTILFGILCIVGFTAVIVLTILTLYIIGILFGIIMIILNTMFETTIVYIFGRAVYNKNFPVCSDSKYIGNNCYAVKSTYCS